MFTGLNESFVTICGYFIKSIKQTTTSNITMKTWGDVEIMVTYGTIGLILALFVGAWCNLLSLQDKTAKNLGLHVTRVRLIISAIAVLLAAVSTAIAGVIAFVGLLVPHISRQLVGSDHKVLIPFSALAGALLILTADTIGRLIVPPNEIPAATIMAVIGGPFLIFCLERVIKFMEIKNVTFSYDNVTNRLKSVSSEIEIGKITTIIGPNGCGKSTLLSVMSRNHAPSSGEVILDGKAIGEYKPKEFARKLAVVHQQNEAPADITVEKLISFGRMPYKNIFSANR